tara:strand:- start:3250 stop:5496 length:2247 start_codon:yes stop_codon:yes gene_type:complete
MPNFKKILCVFTFLFFALNLKAEAEVVNKVTAEGNERISLETIVIFGDIKIGDNYETPDINLLIKKLYQTNFFANISVELKNGILNIIVEENPIINSVVFEGEKADKYKEAISELLNLREKTSYIKNYIKTDVNMIKEFYRSLGFYFIKIDAEVEQLDRNRVNLIYKLDKGKKAKISRIFFLGEKKVREKKLRDIITSQEAKFWKFISRNVYLNKERIELDKRLLENYYKNKGYYEVDIASSNVEYSEGEGFVLSFNINAGQRYRFKKISAEVSESLDKSAFSELEKDFNKVVGDYYSRRKLTSILQKIDKLSEQKELQFINHRVSETLESDGVDIKIEIFEGQKFIIERINIVGNSVTNDSVVRGELVVDEGDPYSALLVNKSVNKLKSRGIFGKVEQKVKEGSSPDLRVLEISVEEKATGEIAAGAGVGTDGTSFMFAVSENNWLGRGIQLQSALNVSEEKISGNIAVANPNYNYSGNSVFTSLDVSSTDKVTNSGYKSTKTGFVLGTEFEQYENIYLSPSINLSFEDIEVEVDATDAMKKMEGSYENIDFSYGITQDSRNQPFQPTDGYITKFDQDIPILMDKSSLMNGISVSGYHGFSEDVIGAFKFYGRSIHGLQGEDTRLTSRLFIPAKRLRGFNTGKVGPKDGADYVGGNYTAALGFEAQLPNLLPESTRTDISLFLDSANVWGVDYNSSLDDSNTIRSSVGVSANMFTTIGPLSFTLAQDITKASQDETQTFNFRLGTSF